MRDSDLQKLTENALDRLFDDDDSLCSCTTCIARTVLEALDDAGALLVDDDPPADGNVDVAVPAPVPSPL